MKSKGFTLLEITIVVAIMIILVVLSVSQLQSVKIRAKNRAIIASMNQLRLEAERSYNVEGNYTKVDCGDGSQDILNICNDMVERLNTVISIYGPDQGDIYKYCAFTNLSEGIYCVDSIGNALELSESSTCSSSHRCQ